MKRILILVEGQTEEQFVSSILQEYFMQAQCYLQPVILRTKRTGAGQIYKGGVSTYDRIRREVVNLLADTSVCAVTTMLDYYGLPDDFPGKAKLMPSWNAIQKVQHLEDAFSQDIGNPRFLPYLSLHEFESLLFSDIDCLIGYLKSQSAVNLRSLQRLRNKPPEEIDENTPPSHHIRNAYASYKKVIDGIMIARQIGLQTMLDKRQHFENWVNQLQHRCRNC